MIRPIMFSALLFASVLTHAQSYWTSSFGDFIFSSANVKSSTLDVQPRVRFTGWLHFSQYQHTDFGKKYGMYTGTSIRNIGLIYEYEDANNVLRKVKHRAYMFGMPLAFKFGNMGDSKFGYLGAELEIAFHYKEKHFESSVKKSIEREWFSPRTQILQPSIFVGWQSGDNWNICAKWYLRDFLNASYSRSSTSSMDLSDFEHSQIFYIAISIHIKSKELKLDNKADDPKFAAR